MTDVTISGKPYKLLKAIPIPRHEDDETSRVCNGCAFNFLNIEGNGCARAVAGTVPSCHGDYIYVSATPESLADYMARKLV